jgi:DtxR family Mn-dependent transcriptional regulator
MPSSTVENYLKAMLQLDESPDQIVNVGAIAEALEVTPGTVTSMMRHLSEEKLVDYVPRRHVALLPRGRQQARQVVRRHRLIETFLVHVMKLDWAEVHAEAEVLEHVISDRLLGRMDEMLGFPSHDPHGDPIPDADGHYPPAEKAQPLDTLEPGPFRLVRVDDSEIGLLDWLSDHRLHVGKQYELTSRDPIAGVITIRPDACSPPLSLSEKIAASILVEGMA